MIALALAAAVAAAPGCPEALSAAAALDDASLAARAPALARAVRELAPPADALVFEALRAEAEQAAGAAAPAAGARFRAALVGHCALAAAPRLPAAGAAERLRAEEILDRPAFRRARADPWAIRRWLRAGWERLLALFETREAQRYALFSQLLFLAAAAGAAGLGAWALLRRRPAEARAAARPDPAATAGPDTRLDAAADAAARGDAARAVRLAMRAALAALERDGALPGGRSLTASEIVGRLSAAAPARREAARTLCAVFDRTVYGARPAGRGEADAALACARALGSLDPEPLP